MKATLHLFFFSQSQLFKENKSNLTSMCVFPTQPNPFCHLFGIQCSPWSSFATCNAEIRASASRCNLKKNMIKIVKSYFECNRFSRLLCFGELLFSGTYSQNWSGYSFCYSCQYFSHVTALEICLGTAYKPDRLILVSVEIKKIACRGMLCVLM